MTTKVPSIPSPTSANLLNVAQAVKNLIDVREGKAGDPLDANVTFRDLIQAGAVAVRPGWSSGSGLPPVAPTSIGSDGYDGTTDLTPPPKPEGFTATGLFASIQLQWNRPQYRNHAYVEIWRSNTNALGSAVLIGTSDTGFYVDQIGTSATRYYWIRFVSQANINGPYSAVDGLSASTAADPGLVLASLSGQITESQLYSSLASRIDLIDAPATVPGSVNARLDVIQAQVNDLSNTPPYSAGTTYSADDLVTYNGGIYRAKTTTTGNLPTNATYWEKIGDYASLGQAVAAHTSQIGTLTTDLSAEVTARQALSAQVNNPTTGLPSTRATLLNDYYTKTATDSAIASSSSSLTTQFNNQLAGYTNTATLVANYYTKSATDAAIAQSSNSLTTQFSNTLTGYVTSANLTANYYTKSATDSAISAATSNLVSNTSLNTTLSSYVTTATLSTNYYTKTQTDSAISSATSSLVSTTALNTALASYTNTATLQANYYTKTQTDSAISSATSTLVSTTALNNALANYTTTAALQTNYYTKTQTDSAISVATTTLQSNVNNQLTGYATTASLQTEATTRANADTSLFAQYTVKTDLAGRVAGFGLASETTTAGLNTSSFAVVADKFWIAAPNDYTQEATPTSGVVAGKVWYKPSTKQTFRYDGSAWVAFSPIIPFVVQTTPTTVNGVSVPAGVYMDAAFIRDGTITTAKIGNAQIDNAKIANLDAAKITTGFLSADRIQAGTLDAKIANIDAAVITTGTINSARIGNLDASKITSGFIDAARIQAGSITTSMINDVATGQIIAGSFNLQIFSTVGTFTWTVPPFVYKLKVTVIGGGGGAGYAATAADITCIGGGGGGGAVKIISVNPGDSLTIRVGAGGSGAVFGSGNFPASGNSSYLNIGGVPSGTNAATVYAFGGGGGFYNSGYQGGQGGGGGNGNLNFTGSYGTVAITKTTNSSEAIGGVGGSAPLIGVSNASTNPAASNSGAGGCSNPAAGINAGSGGSGLVMIEY